MSAGRAAPTARPAWSPISAATRRRPPSRCQLLADFSRLRRKRTARQQGGGKHGRRNSPSAAGPARGFLPRHDCDPGGVGRLFYRVVPRRAVAAGPGSAAAGPAGGIALVIQSLGVVAEQLDRARQDAAALDLDFAIPDRADDPAGGVDGQAVLDGDLAFEAAADLRRIDLDVAL